MSIAYDDNLLLFDDGKNSLNHTPAGDTRTYSAARKYQIDTQAMVATEVWNYVNNPSLYSPFCSSIYEDSPLNYLIDYAIIQNLPGGPFMELMGLDATGTKIFDYQYPTTGCQIAWNAIPIHLEALRLVVQPAPTPTPGPLPLTNGNFETAPFDTVGTVTGWSVSGPGRIAEKAYGATSAIHSAAFSNGGDTQGNVLA